MAGLAGMVVTKEAPEPLAKRLGMIFIPTAVA